MLDTDYKDIVIDNDAIVNTEPAELPEEAQNIPQGVKPELNPNPGYGEDGKTVSAIKTDLKEGARGTPVEVNTNQKPIVVKQEPHNFIGGLYVNGKPVNIDDFDDKGFDILELSNLSGTLTNEEFALALSDYCAIKVSTQYYYKDISSADYLVYKAATRVGSNDTYVESIVITKATKAWEYRAETVEVNSLKYLTTVPTEANTDGLKVVVLDSEPATKYDGYLYVITED